MAPPGAISFTRNKNFLIRKQGTQGLSGVGCVLELDGEKMTEKYKIQPYNYHGLDVDAGDESEERILNRNVDNVKKYITGITIYKIYFPEPGEKDNMVLSRNLRTGQDDVTFEEYCSFIKNKISVPIKII